MYASNLSYLAYIGVFIGALLAYEGLRQTLSRRENRGEAKSRRLRMLNAGATPGEVLQLLKPPEHSGLLSRIPLLSRLPRLMRQAGITMKPQVLLMLCCAGGLLLFLLASRTVGPVAGLGAAVVGGLLAPVIVLDAMRKKRSAKLVSQLPDALELMARGLRVGHPLNASLASVANEMADPIGTEFGLVVDQVSYGDDVVSAMKDLADRIDEEDLHYLAISIGIQHGTGGNLARLLTVLAKVIRDRITMRRRIKAISAEGRVSMYILSAVPFVIFGFVNVTAPDFYGSVSDHPQFMPVMAVVGALVVVNFLVLRRLVAFRF